MNKDLLTKKIMFSVATKEEVRLKKVLMIALPLLLILVIVNIVSTHKTIDRLIEKDFFTLIHDFEIEEDKIIPQVGILGNKLVEEIFEGLLAVVVITLVAIIVIFINTDILSFPKRFRETKKYKG